MSTNLNDTPSANRIHIGFYGRRNAGKSSLVNAVTGQELAVVSDVKGTTTDPVRKAMELLPLGPVVIIDTPGLDDEGALGEKRVQKTRETLAKTDIAVLVIDAETGIQTEDRELEALLQQRKLPYLVVWNKCDLLSDLPPLGDAALYVSAKTGTGISALKERLGSFARLKTEERRVVADLLSPGDTVVLVIPVDESAPKGRLILPQQQTIRDILDAHCSMAVCQPEELSGCLAGLRQPPRMVITDSQVFGKIAPIVPSEIPLTSFSILFARYKGNLLQQVQGAAALSRLRDGDRVLISEGCTHHRQCNDIGSVKLPGWIRAFSGAEPEFSFTSGGTFPEDLSPYALIVHCGGCMLNAQEMGHRASCAAAAGVPMVNYGVAIAQMHGILKRSLALFPDAGALL